MSKIKMLRKEAQVALPNSGETYIAEDGTVSMVLDDNHDDQYEPTDQEIKEYAQWLGMELPEDEELLWLAREGLRAPLPKEWKPCKTDTGDVYYFNFKSGDSIWDHPMDEHFKSKFKTEKERLKKQKESGGAYQDTLSKVASRNNIVFTDKGVVKHESATTPPAVSTPRSDRGGSKEDEKPLAQQGRGMSATSSSSAPSTPHSTTKADAGGSLQKAVAASAATPTAKAASVAKKEKETTKPIPAAEEHPAADPQPESPRLVSEAEKILQERVKSEAEADHKKKLQQLEDEWNKKTSDLRQTSDADFAETKRQLVVNKRNQIGKIEDSLQEELEQQQRNVDQRSKREIQKLQDDIEEARERTRAAQQSGSQRTDSEFADIERRMREALASRVADIESEISSIRIRHAKAQMDLVDQEKQRLQLESNRVAVDAKEKVAADFEARAKQLRDEHADRISRLRAEARHDMEEETRRSQPALGNDQAVEELRKKCAAEVASIEDETNGQVKELRSREESRRAALLAQIDAEVAQLMRSQDAASTLEEQETLSAIDADADSQIRSLHDRHAQDRAAWREGAVLLRTQAVDGARSRAQPNSVNSLGAQMAESIASETAALLKAKAEMHAEEEERLRSALAAEATRGAESSLRTAVLNAIEKDLDAFIAEQQRTRSVEQERFEESKRRAQLEHDQGMRAYEEKIRQHSGSAPPTITRSVTVPATAESIRRAAEAPLQEALRNTQSIEDQKFQLEGRDLRARLAQQHSDEMLRLADELAMLEQDKRRSIDAILSSEASAFERNATVSTSSKAPSGGVLPAELEERLSAVRAEFAEREASLRTDMNQRIESSRLLATSIRQAATTLRSKCQEGTVHPEAPGLPPRCTTPQMKASSPQPAWPSGMSAKDALAFLAEEQRGLATRQETLAHAQREWLVDHEQHHSNPLLQRAQTELLHQEAELHKDVGSLRALEKYYRTQVMPPRHSDPMMGDAKQRAESSNKMNTQIVAALHKLNDKLESLSARVAHMSHSSGAAGDSRRIPRSSNVVDGASPPRGTKSSKRTPSAEKPAHGVPPHHRDSSADLATKWGGILNDVARCSSRSHHQGRSGAPHYEDAIRQYLHGE